MDESQTYSPFCSVLLREWQRMTSRRLYFGVCIVLPLFTLFFMATILATDRWKIFHIGIVDQDNTATSRAIARNISAVPTFKVTKHFADEAAAVNLYKRKRFMVIFPYLPNLSKMLSPEKKCNTLLLLSLCIIVGRR